jgi:Tol biopolymer transport system component
MKRTIVGLVSMLLIMAACSESSSSPDSPEATADAAGSASDRVVFKRLDPSVGGTVIYTANSDGSQVKKVFAEEAELPRWSPDGKEISIFCCGEEGNAAHLLDADAGKLRALPQPDPKMQTFCGGSWSPDGKRITCAAYSDDDPKRNGIYTIRASDGGDLQKITSFPGGDYSAGDYSPDGKRLVFIRAKNERVVGLFVVNVDGTGLKRLTPRSTILDDGRFAGRWSPNGDQILFVARSAEENHKAIWMVSADGGPPKQLEMTPACGGPSTKPKEFGCYSPDWSPDGKKIIFARSDGNGESIYTVNADGTDLVEVTDGEDDQPDWGPRGP